MRPARRVRTWISWWAITALVGGCSKAPDAAGQGAKPAPSFSAAVSAQGRSPIDLSSSSRVWTSTSFTPALRMAWS